MKYIPIVLALVCCANQADAQHRSHRPGPVRGNTRTPFQNLITAGPAFGTIGGKPAASFGVCYERFVGKRGLHSVLILCTAYTGGTVGTVRVYDERIQYHGYHAGLGMAWHPASHDRRVDFSLGILPTLGYGSAQGRQVTDPNGGGRVIRKEEAFAALLGQMAITLNTRGYHFRPTFFMQGGPVFSGLGDLPGSGSGWFSIGVRFGAGF